MIAAPGRQNAAPMTSHHLSGNVFTIRESVGFGTSQSATGPDDVADEDGRKASEYLECSAVADTEPQAWDTDL